MTKFYYGSDSKGKLVRDKLEAKHIEEGHKLKARRLKPSERGAAILEKFVEEHREMVEAHSEGDRAEKIMELADLQTLIDSYEIVEGISKDEVAREMERKTAIRGAFVEGLVVEWVDFMPDGVDYEKWVTYCRANADRYPEEMVNE
jgi:predicted house-cleaning noncanonical NTP pyrophosphatase (MazG superfamily)